MIEEGITTDALIDAHAGATGIPREQLLLIVAKSALIRALALDDRYQDSFILKGGSLLHHVYGSPRHSIRDADYTHLKPEELTEEHLKTALNVEVTGFKVDPERSQIQLDNGLWVAHDLEFTIKGVTVRRRRDTLDLTVSVRPGERLDTYESPLPPYIDDMLLAPSSFEVQGLTRNELAAEKVLGWVSKTDLKKHYVDLAILARDHQSHVDPSKVADLIITKFSKEKGDGRYGQEKLSTVRDVARMFSAPEKQEEFRAGWEAAVDRDLFLHADEEDRARDMTLLRCDNVGRINEEFWADTMGRLAGHVERKIVPR